MPGIERRSQIDTETFKALLLINGGGAVALLSILASILEKDNLKSLARAILVGLLILMAGLASAIIHNHLRRRCSLIYEQHQMNPPKGQVLGISLPSPTVCFFSWLFMWGSVLAFVSAGALIAIVGICTIS
jgi:hypothetical protein